MCVWELERGAGCGVVRRLRHHFEPFFEPLFCARFHQRRYRSACSTPCLCLLVLAVTCRIAGPHHAARYFVLIDVLSSLLCPNWGSRLANPLQVSLPTVTGPPEVTGQSEDAHPHTHPHKPACLPRLPIAGTPLTPPAHTHTQPPPLPPLRAPRTRTTHALRRQPTHSITTDLDNMP